MTTPHSMPYPVIDGVRPLLGHMPEMQRDTYGFYLRHHRASGDSLRFNAYPFINFYSFAAPDALHHILIKARQKYSRGARWSRIVSHIGGKGIVTSTGDIWEKQRRAVTPYFQPAHVDKYTDMIVRNTYEMAQKWRRAGNDTTINVSREMMSLGLVNISDMLFNYDIRPRVETFASAMVDGFYYINRFIQNPLTPPRFLPLPVNRRFARDKAIADAVVRDIIAAVRKDDENCMINALVRAGNTDRQLHDEIITLLMAGYDTLSTALAWAWYLLARNPAALGKVKEELRDVLGPQGLPNAENVERLSYLRMVFKETLRLYPSAWAIHRFSEEADEVIGFPVRKGSSVVLPLYVTHRHPDFWKHPDEFYPEHFDKAEVEGRPRFAYLPFGAGEHVCVGAHLAGMEGVLILATLLQHLTPRLATGAEIAPLVNFTLKPSQDIVSFAV
ncbi:MAG: cytochrome P450 [Alphaproteobacteria bacterium]|nr:cytochrome P450 [Alphaproteobacteria bacterium]